MNEVIDRIYATGMVQDAEGKQHIDPARVSRDTGEILYHFVRDHSIIKTIEVGMANGLSALFILQALTDKGGGEHTAMDPLQQSVHASIGLANVKRAGLDHQFRFYESGSEKVLPPLLEKGETFDFAFVDGMHLFDYITLDLFYIDKLLRVGGFIAVDDLWMPSVRKALNFFLRNRDYEVVRSTKGSASLARRAARIGRRIAQTPFTRDWGLKLNPNNVVILKKKADDSREWNFHRAF